MSLISNLSFLLTGLQHWPEHSQIYSEPQCWLKNTLWEHSAKQYNTVLTKFYQSKWQFLERKGCVWQHTCRQPHDPAWWIHTLLQFRSISKQKFLWSSPLCLILHFLYFLSASVALERLSRYCSLQLWYKNIAQIT